MVGFQVVGHITLRRRWNTIVYLQWQNQSWFNYVSVLDFYICTCLLKWISWTVWHKWKFYVYFKLQTVCSDTFLLGLLISPTLIIAFKMGLYWIYPLFLCFNKDSHIQTFSECKGDRFLFLFLMIQVSTTFLSLKLVSLSFSPFPLHNKDTISIWPVQSLTTKFCVCIAKAHGLRSSYKLLLTTLWGCY